MNLTRTKSPSFSRLKEGSLERVKSNALVAASVDFCKNARPKRSEVEQFKEQFYSLVAYTDENARREISKQVAANEYVPRAVLLFLAIDAPIVAAPVIARSKTLGQLDLMQIIDKKGTVHHRVIANRADIGPSVVAKLINLGDRLVARRLLANTKATYTLEQKMELELIAIERPIAPTADLPELPLQNETEKAKADIVAPQSITRIPDQAVPSIETPLFIADEQAPVKTDVAAIDDTEKQVSETEFSAEMVSKITDKAVKELLQLTKRNVRGKAEQSRSDTKVVFTSAATFYSAMLDAASRNHRQDQMLALRNHFGISMETCARVFDDQYGDTLAVALKASSMEDADAKGAIMLCMPNVGLSVHNMKRISVIYDQLDPAACLAAVRSWEADTQTDSTQQTTRFESFLAEVHEANTRDRGAGVVIPPTRSNIQIARKAS